MDKHSVLLQTFVNYRRKKFYNTFPRVEVPKGSKLSSFLFSSNSKHTVSKPGYLKIEGKAKTMVILKFKDGQNMNSLMLFKNVNIIFKLKHI